MNIPIGLTEALGWCVDIDYDRGSWRGTLPMAGGEAQLSFGPKYTTADDCQLVVAADVGGVSYLASTAVRSAQHAVNVVLDLAALARQPEPIAVALVLLHLFNTPPREDIRTIRTPAPQEL